MRYLMAALLASASLAGAATAQDQAAVQSCHAHADKAERIAACTRLVDMGATGNNLAVVLDLRGNAYWDLDRNAEARRDLDAAVAADPAFVTVRITRGMFLASQGDLTAATADFEEAMRLDPNSASPYFSRSLVRFEQDNFEGALSDIDRAIAMYDWHRYHVQRGIINAYLGRSNDTIGDMTLAIALGSTDIRATSYRARAHMALQAWDAALVDLNAVIAQAPQDGWAFADRGDYWMRRKDYVQAEADFAQADRLEPGDPAITKYLCFLRAATDSAQATATCDRAVALAPDDGDALASRGLLALKRGGFDAALADYDAAIRADPAASGQRYGRGVTLMRLGRTAEGQADILAAIQIDPTIASLYAEWGVRP